MNDQGNQDRQRNAVRPSRRRRRIPLACSVCRSRKTRCDAQLPSCLSCVQRGLGDACTYDEGAQKSQKYINELEKKIRSLETQKPSETPFQPVGAGPSSASDFVIEDWQEAERQESLPAGAEQNHQPIGQSNLAVSFPLHRQIQPSTFHTGTSPRPQSSRSLDSNIEASIDALTTVSPLGKDTDQYGESSTIAFVSRVVNATSHSDNSPRNPSSAVPYSGLNHGDLVGLELIGGLDQNAFLLPPRRTADSFLHCYWEFVHPLFPAIHKTTFLDMYARLWEPTAQQYALQGDKVHDMVFHSILNVIFALGCQFSGALNAEEKISSSREFYERSRRLLAFEMLDAGHLQLVQVLLLTGIYLQSTKLASRCWNAVGLAIRVAYSLGLHKSQPISSPGSQLDVEMRRRIWHTCVMLDRLLAMTFGRPTTIPRTWNTEAPSLIDDEYLSRNKFGVQPPSSPSRMGLFVYSVALFEILDDVLSTFYIQETLQPKNGNVDQWSYQLSSDVLKFHTRLEDFMANLPDYLQHANASAFSSQDSDYIALQNRVLHSRFLYVRILILRPVILAAIQGEHGTAERSASTVPGLAQEISRAMCILCVRTAHDLISILHENLGNNYRSSAWHMVYFTFAATTVLIASRLISVDKAQSDIHLFQVSWAKSVAILEQCGKQVESSSKALSVLKELRSSISHLLTDPNYLQQSQTETGRRSDSKQIYDSSTIPINSNYNFQQPELLNESAPVTFHTEGFSDIDFNWFNQQLVETDWLQMANDNNQGYF